MATESRTLYLSGCVGSLLDGTPVGDTLRAQVAQTFRNVSTVLASQGAPWADIAKMTIHVVDHTPEKRADPFGGIEDYVTASSTDRLRHRPPGTPRSASTSMCRMARHEHPAWA